ncbi:nucleoside-triphosphatase [Williamwhitmania taraxaci]|uniref:Nucleoside-triphosphatase THEP1 n=1 Tax=Williamwhitmania taraxaci TaxID=1640674 RepID=A0A1G6KVZ6_9BACT|nr:nucleoside-triphosphatase [Williamwhitmania taraxaci]SDC35272.1 Nucleoside-triphosphatase THEP1 [Williamwhitmania taraxaci]
MIKHIPYIPLSDKWLKASVIGSLWAVVEIVLGSMLHNLRIPFAGSILSFFAVYLIIAFFQVWKTNGIIWRAGLICALMKSLSPSAIIIGPMTGIMAEALILELIILGIGKNLFSYGIGGALAVFSVVIHKAISLLILYGWDIVKLLENIYLFAAKHLNFDGVAPSQILIIVSGIYLSLGYIAGTLGYYAGRKYIKHNSTQQNLQIKKPSQGHLFQHTSKKNQSWLILPLIFVMLLGVMYSIASSSIIISSVLSTIFIVIIGIRYKNNLRFLMKPAFWLQLIFILVFSSFFYQGFSVKGILQSGGWIIGCKMVLRALVLLTSFSAISVELKNPVIKNILYKRGLKNLYQSLELAFSALPSLIQTFASESKSIFGLKKVTYLMLNCSQSLLNNFTEAEETKTKVFIISGEVNGGKTTLAKNVINLLQMKNVEVNGFLTVAINNELSEKTYYLEEIKSGTREFLCSNNPVSENEKSGRFYFSEAGILFGRKIIEQPIQQGMQQLTVIDEIGPLEIQGKGWAPSIAQQLAQNNSAQLWIVRASLVNAAIRKWNVGEVFIFHLHEEREQEIATCIFNNLEAEKTKAV